MSSKLGLCSPWVDFYKMINALFERDPEVAVSFDDETYTISLKVDNAIKADAIQKILPATKSFGNVEVFIKVIPANEDESTVDLFKRAFEGNPAVDDIIKAGPFGNNFVIFDKAVVQYYNDSLTDAFGYKSTLYQNIAEEVFDTNGEVLFSTNVE